jgi:predicted membrane-bound dolichyl-phosphate-mannose-protein mannosyltransferase
MIKTKKLLFFLIIIFIFLIKIYSEKNSFVQKFDFEKVDKLYQESQFAENPANRKLVIQDWDLYPYAGLVYLKTGQLDKVNIEHPPLGKYLLGLSILLTGNPNLVQIPFALGLLCLSFFISYQLLKNIYLSFLIPLCLINEFLFFHRTTNALLDLFQTAFIALFLFLIILKPGKSKLKMIILGLVLGIIASIKFPAAAAILGICFFANLFVENKGFKKSFFDFLSITFIGILVFCLTYTPLFLKQGIRGFLNLQIKALKIHLSHLPEYPPFIPLRVMFLNQWPVWWDQINPIHQAEEWNIFWPFLALAIILSPFFYWQCRKRNDLSKKLIIFLFSWSYFIFINSRLFFPGYLFPVLPYLYLLLVWEIKTIFSYFRLAITKQVSPQGRGKNSSNQ